MISASLGTTFFVLNRKKKLLLYDIVSKTRLLSIKEEMAGKVHIVVGDERVQDVGLVRINVINAGTEPIKAAEFVRPISFTMSEGVKIIEADVSEQLPPNLGATVQQEDRRIVISPLLLNAKDAISLKLLIANFDGRIDPDARIEGGQWKPKFNSANIAGLSVLVAAAESTSPVSVVAARFFGALVKNSLAYRDLKTPGDRTDDYR